MKLSHMVKEYDLNSKEHRISDTIHATFGIYFPFQKICSNSSNGKFLKHVPNNSFLYVCG